MRAGKTMKLPDNLFAIIGGFYWTEEQEVFSIVTLGKYANSRGMLNVGDIVKGVSGGSDGGL